MKFEILKKINSNSIISFTAGVIFTILFNLVVNKEPFKINSDSISSLANVGTFVVALMAALQVRKWLDGKKKETGFNHTVKILELIEKSHEDIEPLLKQFSNIKNAVKMMGDINFTVEEKTKLKENINKVDMFCNRLVMSLGMLKYWNMELSSDSKQKIHNFTTSLRNANTILDAMVSFPKFIEERIKEVEECHQKAFQNVNEFLDYSYDDIFIPKNLTSPSKKVEK